ncbi:MAG: hypothetical protein HUJ28_08155 [Chromatiales bacterium]|nr:hypothetical protein [Chromatiales bacterium]
MEMDMDCRPAFVLPPLLFLSACALPPESREPVSATDTLSLFSSATPGCQSSSTVIDGKTIDTVFCIRQEMFKPSQYLVRVNGQTVFAGSSKGSPEFSKEIVGGVAEGTCVSMLSVYNMAEMKPAIIDSLPESVIADCRIDTNDDMRVKSFEESPVCHVALNKFHFATRGNTDLVPVELSRVCGVSLNDKEVFRGEFSFE